MKITKTIIVSMLDELGVDNDFPLEMFITVDNFSLNATLSISTEFDSLTKEVTYTEEKEDE